MGCRCAEISKLVKDINNLKNALNYIESAASIKNTIVNELDTAAKTYENAVKFNGEESTTANLVKCVHNNASASVDNAKVQVSQAISVAQSRLNSLRGIDRIFHENQRKKHH